MSGVVRPPGTYPGALPLLGHALRMKRNPGSFLLELQSGEPVVRIRLGREPMYVVNDPDLVRDVMRRPDAFARGGPIAERFRQMFGNGLGISDGPFHRRQRRLILSAFHHGRIADYVAVMSGHVEDKAASWRDGQRVAVHEEMDELALANIVRVIVADGATLDRARFMAATAVVLGGLFRRMTGAGAVFTRLPTPGNRRYREAEAFLRRTIEAVVDDYLATGTDRGDLLSKMVLARDDDGRPAMSDRQLHDEVMTFLIAGSNTVSNTLSWAFHEIGAHPDVERRLHEEVDRVLAGRTATYQDIDRLEYTRRLITETLRHRTQGLFQSRVATVDSRLGGYHVPAGAVVLYSAYALNHNPRIHADAERFDPDRWLPERVDPVARGAFLPFGTGLHGCLGEGLSRAELTVSLATIAARWRLVPVPGHRVRPKPAVTMPVNALPMIAHSRGVGSRADGLAVAREDPGHG
ncbi:pentalenene oxygenase [Saccharothrix carnea]|uniref:Pentalenene oxygenase n=1 Tax=Saccharothrix carnea TaxID=1280637 RepID=A0A2P8HD14_SACCR|nr:cytochrome P450 [Saccharothrix carnea]PSL44134.1 pentalenene oxygenase [Saccharothrix carnea]